MISLPLPVVLKRFVVYTMGVTIMLVNVNERLLILLNGMIIFFRKITISLLVEPRTPYMHVDLSQATCTLSMYNCQIPVFHLYTLILYCILFVIANQLNSLAPSCHLPKTSGFICSLT